MNRIFLTLGTLANLGLAAAFILGWMVVDRRIPGASGVPLGVHILCGLGALTLALLVHAIVLTYFMGTGRWIEETTQAYGLSIDARRENVRLKYQTLPGMIGCLALLIITGALGAAADPGAALNWSPAKSVHMVLACVSMVVNLGVSVIEYQTIERNGRLIEEIMSQVRATRAKRGQGGRQPVS